MRHDLPTQDPWPQRHERVRQEPVTEELPAYRDDEPSHARTRGSRRIGRRVVASVAAAATLGGGILVGAKLFGENSRASEQQQPVAEAPAFPQNPPEFEIPPAVAEEPTVDEPSEVLTVPESDPTQWDTSNYPFLSENGEILVGDAGVASEYGLNVEEYPTATEVGPAFVERMNMWVNELTDSSAPNFPDYSSFSSADEQVAGPRAAARELVGPGIGSALTMTTDEVPFAVSPEPFVADMIAFNEFVLANTARAKSQGGEYEASITADSVTESATTDTELAFSFRATFEDNGNPTDNGRITSQGMTYVVTMRKMPNEYGDGSSWVAYSIQPGPSNN